MIFKEEGAVIEGDDEVEVEELGIVDEEEVKNY